MKFSLQCVRSPRARLGKLSEVGCHGDREFVTPMCLLYTRLGSVPHLTAEMLQKVEDVPQMTHIPLNLLASHHEAVKAFDKGIAKFSALKDQLVYTSIQDPATEVLSGYNDKSSVGVWGRGGKIKLDVELFITMQEAMLPDWFQCLCDADTNRDSTRKRARKSVDRTLGFLDEVVDGVKKSERLKSSSLFGSLVGGWHEGERRRSAQETSARPVEGFVIEGFHNYGPKSEDFHMNEIKDLLRVTMDQIPEEKPRVMHGVWGPDTVIDAVEMGVDIFDSSYPYMATERGEALVFSHCYSVSLEQENTQLPSGLTIDLNDKQFADDFSPLLPHCTCYTCQKFSRAYINHLLNTSELLANILLIMHNLHHYLRFFTSLRSAIEADKLADLKGLIHQQLATSAS